MDRSLQADLVAKGMTFNKPDPVRFRVALVKAGFYAVAEDLRQRGLGAAGTVYRAADVMRVYAARLISPRMVRAAQTNNSAPSVVVTAAESSE